ncbi:tol-pal system protein YbgF [bacterium]|nr:tol-pal system protein YbgF [bacterium]
MKKNRFFNIPVLFKMILLWLTILIFFTGCASRNEILQFQNDHTDIKQDIDAVDKRLVELETRLDTLMSLLGGDVSQHFSNQEEILRSMRADQRAVSYELETLVQTLAARISDSDVHTRNLVQKLDEVNRLVTEIVSKQDSSKIPTNFDVNDPEKLYQQSYLDFTRGDAELARYGFQQYLDLYPKTRLADNALYWIGESYMNEGNQDAALDAFQKLEKSYPKSNKSVVSLLKRGLIQAANGNSEQAKSLFEKIIKNFPNTPESVQAKIRLEEMAE